MPFTKQEAISLLGKTVEITQTIFFELDIDQRFPKIEKGTLAEVYLIENNPEGITVSLLVDEQYETFTKTEFEAHCQLFNPESIHVCSM